MYATARAAGRVEPRRDSSAVSDEFIDDCERDRSCRSRERSRQSRDRSLSADAGDKSVDD
jgi:hypothetical protein